MNRFFNLTTGVRRCLLAAVTVVVTVAALPAAASAFTAADVNASIDKGLAFLDANQNGDGSWGTTDPGAESALALGSYGVKGYANLTPAEQTIVQNGVKYLLGTQGTDGGFAADDSGFLKTYDTGTALIALSELGDVPTTPAGAIPTAIAGGRSYLINNQVVTGKGTTTACTPGGTQVQGGNYCGGWNYNETFQNPNNRSDESNTGFALTGLDLTGGVPADVSAADMGWQRNVQQLTSNPGGFPARNDGGGAYTPGTSSGDFSSNANDNGSLLFGYGYDGIAASDPGVQAAIKIAQDTLDTYETAGAKANRTMVFHTGMNEDGSCDPAAAGCDWSFGAGEGGYHYSLFALGKGLEQYLPADLSDASNYYSKIVDLLLTQQGTDGSWPFDPRDDGSQIGATGFAILALGRVGAPPDQAITATGSAVSSTEGQPFSGTVATFTDPDTSATASEYSATVDWGDGSTSAGTISGTGGNFTVSGSHTYAEEGSYTVKVTITDVDNTPNVATTSNTATVADAALTGAGAAVTGVEGASASHTVATFTDANAGAPVSDFTATINWGDGSTSAGTVSGSGGKFTVSGTHGYAEEGTYTVKVSIKDDGGSTAAATDTAKVADARLHGSSTRRVLRGQFSGTIARFTDSDPGGKLSDYTATINWGDGKKTAGAISRGATFKVGGSHRFDKPGVYHITVTIKDEGGSRAIVHSQVVIVSPGSAALSTPKACVASSFAAELRGKQIAGVTYTWDGSGVRVTTVHGGTLYRAVITVPPGRHHLTVKVTFRKASHTKSRTLNRTITGCPPVPNFTG